MFRADDAGLRRIDSGRQQRERRNRYGRRSQRPEHLADSAWTVIRVTANVRGGIDRAAGRRLRFVLAGVVLASRAGGIRTRGTYALAHTRGDRHGAKHERDGEG